MDGPKLGITVLANNHDVLRHCQVTVKHYPQVSNNMNWGNTIAMKPNVIPNTTKLPTTTLKPNRLSFRWIKLKSIRGHPTLICVSKYQQTTFVCYHNLKGKKIFPTPFFTHFITNVGAVAKSGNTNIRKVLMTTTASNNP